MSRKKTFPTPLDERTRRQTEAMVEAEQRGIEGRRTDFREAPGAAGSPDAARRRFIAGAAAIAGTAGILARPAAAQAPPGAVEYEVPDDPTKVQGRLTGADGGYGTRSQFEDEVRWRYPTATRESSWTMTPLQDGHGIITPSGLHFERHHGGIPTIDPDTHSLTVHGMVERPMQYSMQALQRFPAESRIHFIECSGNGLTEWREPTLETVQGTHGLTSTSEWTGVPLSTILAEVGVKSGAAWVLAEGRDAAAMTRSVPLDKCWEDAMLAYAQNGEALRPEQGYPLRLLLPGYEGNTQIKWLRRLEISDQPFMTREETSKYTDLLANGQARQFSLVMEAKSVITRPSGGMQLDGPGFYEVTGLAWSGRGRIKQVEISANGGEDWQIAALQTPILPLCHTRFRMGWHWDGKATILQSRCQDETGYVQPTIGELVDVRGLNGKFGSVYHLNGIQSWAIDEQGRVTNVHHY